MREEFVNMLEGFYKSDNRAALAKLRRGLGKKPGEAMEVYSVIGNFLAQAKNRAEEDVLYTLATLYGLYPSESSKEESNFGESVSKLAEKQVDRDSVEKRFVALLNSHIDDLPNHLRHMISLLKSKDIRINWLQLLNDIIYWDLDDRRVQRSWAKRFWTESQSSQSIA